MSHDYDARYVDEATVCKYSAILGSEQLYIGDVILSGSGATYDVKVGERWLVADYTNGWVRLQKQTYAHGVWDDVEGPGSVRKYRRGQMRMARRVIEGYALFA